ncbi:HEPN domain-containing protein [Roseospira visakhapatnamensis]|uniref:HEPN domain-containing protein n=1 Tax=Roseospira visakhapatnamensis TaxID=390880 RepID=A0A7W6WAN0_9PROT|nr:HEPN domain-containing protein [Roseospira visakhapatnamensis]MBB4267018.1 HEPN domain-containing protein [Roseospira visakhapatnamensis]
MTPRESAQGWLRQAHNDLIHAQWSLQAGHLDWACFAAHQAAERALKGLALESGHRPLSTSNPALLAVDLIELGVLGDDDVVTLGDLESLATVARQARDPDRAIPSNDDDAHDSRAAALVAQTEKVVALVSATTGTGTGALAASSGQGGTVLPFPQAPLHA